MGSSKSGVWAPRAKEEHTVGFQTWIFRVKEHVFCQRFGPDNASRTVQSSLPEAKTDLVPLHCLSHSSAFNVMLFEIFLFLAVETLKKVANNLNVSTLA